MAISEAKKVKLVFLISQKCVGSKGKELRAMINILTGMLTNVKSSLKKIVYLFTHFKEEDRS